MTDEKHKVSDKASEFARTIWLAGVGAYGRAVGEAQDRLEKAGVDTPKLFRDLVKAGAALEDEARTALTASHEARSSVEERIQRVRENFRLQRSGSSDDLHTLHEKIDRLSEQVDALTAALLEAGITTPPRKARKARKAAPKAAAKSGAKAATKAKTAATKKTRAKSSAGEKASGSGRSTAKAGSSRRTKR